MKLRKSIEIPASKITEVTRNKRRFAVGTYKVAGKEYKAWRVLGMVKGYKKKK